MELCELVPEISRKRAQLQDVYDFLLAQQPVTSKKKILYHLIEDDESFDCFVGADDKCFEANWNVIIGKEVEISDDVDISMLEIVVNAFLCIMLIGFTPKRFAEFQSELRELMH